MRSVERTLRLGPVVARTNLADYLPWLFSYNDGPGYSGVSLTIGARGADPLLGVDVSLPARWPWDLTIDWTGFGRTKGSFAGALYGMFAMAGDGSRGKWLAWADYHPPLPRISIADSFPTISVQRGGIRFPTPPIPPEILQGAHDVAERLSERTGFDVRFDESPLMPPQPRGPAADFVILDEPIDQGDTP